jgi:DNA repair exonuclease SbcCD ATPase subunit
MDINKKEEELKQKTEEKYDEYEKYKELQEKTHEKEKEIAELQVKMSKLNETCNRNKELIEKKEKYNRNLKEIKLINEKYDIVTKEIEEQKKEITNSTSELFSLKNRFENIEKAETEREELSKIKKINDIIIDVLRNHYIDGILTETLIPRFCKELNEILSHYVNYSIDMICGERSLSIKKIDSTGRSNINGISGYESLMVNIAFRIAINRVNRKYTTNFFIIDEGFAFCDSDSITKIEDLFKFMRELYKYVIVISHDDRIKMYADTNIQVTKKDGCSYVNMMAETNKKLFEQHETVFDDDESMEKKKKKKTKVV